MPKSDSSNSNSGPSYSGPRYRPNWLAALICLVLGTYLFVALIDYEPAQSTLVSTARPTRNMVGWLGADAVWVLMYTIGLSTWLIPFFLYWMFYVAIRNARRLAA